MFYNSVLIISLYMFSFRHHGGARRIGWLDLHARQTQTGSNRYVIESLTVTDLREMNHLLFKLNKSDRV